MDGQTDRRYFFLFIRHHGRRATNNVVSSRLQTTLATPLISSSFKLEALVQFKDSVFCIIKVSLSVRFRQKTAGYYKLQVQN